MMVQQLREGRMTLNRIELDFLARLSFEPWTSPPVFDHGLLDRLVQAGYVTAQSAALDALYYEITDSGRAAAIAAGL
jgi:DNA-binding PadR family transcriptional regulator